MPCKRTQLSDDVFMFECTRRSDLPDCDVCQVGRAEHACAFPLRGKKEGQVCGRPLCKNCALLLAKSAAGPAAGTAADLAAEPKMYCGPHYRILTRR